jgi:hypothetical protein
LTGYTDTVGTFSMTGGSLLGGTLYATSYGIQSGTVTTTLGGPGDLSKTTAASAALGTVQTGNVTVSNGSITATSISTGTLTVAAGSTVKINALAGGPTGAAPVAPLSAAATSATAAATNNTPVASTPAAMPAASTPVPAASATASADVPPPVVQNHPQPAAAEKNTPPATLAKHLAGLDSLLATVSNGANLAAAITQPGRSAAFSASSDAWWNRNREEWGWLPAAAAARSNNTPAAAPKREWAALDALFAEIR